MNNNFYKQKYIKYKTKYCELKNNLSLMRGGSDSPPQDMVAKHRAAAAAADPAADATPIHI